MISRFSVQGFKSLLDAEIDLGSVNVFIGANGSGKSNLLEALGVMGAAAFGSVEPETLRYRGVRPGLPWLYKTSFKHKPFRRIITLEASTRNAKYKLGLDNPINSPAVKWRITSESLYDQGREVLTRAPRGCNLYNAQGVAERIKPALDQTAVKLALARREGVSEARALVRDLEEYAIYSPLTPVLRAISQEEISRDPLGLSGGNLAKAIKELRSNKLHSLGPFDLEDVWEMLEWADAMRSVRASEAPLSPAVKAASDVLRFRDRFMRPERNAVSAYDASEGALYVLFLLVLVAHERAPRVFAVDNFDHTLHPRLATALTRMVTRQILRDGTRQMLATTQNPLALDGLDLGDDRVRLFAVDRDKDGVTRVTRVTLSRELLEQEHKGLSLSRLWVMGRLGGVPKSL